MELSFKIISSEDHIDDQIHDFIAANDNDFYPPISARTSLDKFVRSVYDYNGKYFICLQEGRIIGLMSVYLTDPSFIFYYNYLAIDKDFRKHGISTTLFNMVHELCRQHGAQRAMGKTWSTNQASKALFKKHGFFHVETIEDHRSKGVHSFFYAKSFSGVRFQHPVTRLGIIAGNNHYALGNFAKTISCIPKTTFNDYTPLPFTIISDAFQTASTVKGNGTIEQFNDTVSLLEKNEVSHLLFLDSYNYPALDLARINPGIEVIDFPAIIRKLVNETKKKCLFVAADYDESKTFFGIDNIVVPQQNDANRIKEIVADIKSGCVVPAYYKQEVVAMASANDCNAVLLGSAELHTIFGFDKMYDGIELFDPWMEIAIIVQDNSLKFRNHFTTNNTDI